MKDDFCFEEIGKKMPYNVPDGFFDQMEKTLNERLAAETYAVSKPPVATRKRLWIASGAVAAAVLLAFVVWTILPKEKNSGYDFDAVEMAFNQLSADDQAYLIEIYEDDIFANE